MDTHDPTLFGSLSHFGHLQACVVSCAIQSVLMSYLFCPLQCICADPSLPIRPTFLPLLVSYVCLCVCEVTSQILSPLPCDLGGLPCPAGDCVKGPLLVAWCILGARPEARRARIGLSFSPLGLQSLDPCLAHSRCKVRICG